jgi:predicted dehydrogenase
VSIQIAVCGAGAFGRNHIRLYRELPGVFLAAVVDPVTPDPAITGPAATGETGQAPAVPVAVFPSIFPSTEAMLTAIQRGELHIDAASVCVPTSAHHAVAAQLLQAGIHVLVEKPIASTLAQADDLIALAQKHQRVLMVGHLERFNPAVQAVLPLLRGPMFFEAHRLSIFSPRSLDVDVVLDLMIHDLDIVLTLAQSPVAQVHAVGLPILSPKTDIANVRVEFASGCVANFTASRVSTERVRKLRFFQPHQYLSIDYARQDLLVIEVTPAIPSVTNPPATTPGMAASAPPLALETLDLQKPTPPALPTLGMQKPTVTPGEPLRLELEAFLHAIRTSTAPPVTGQQARDALALALQVQQAIATHTQHAGLQAFTTPPQA